MLRIGGPLGRGSATPRLPCCAAAVRCAGTIVIGLSPCRIGWFASRWCSARRHRRSRYVVRGLSRTGRHRSSLGRRGRALGGPGQRLGPKCASMTGAERPLRLAARGGFASETRPPKCKVDEMALRASPVALTRLLGTGGCGVAPTATTATPSLATTSSSSPTVARAAVASDSTAEQLDKLLPQGGVLGI